MALTLWAVRHGATDTPGLCVGQHDVPTVLSAQECAAVIQRQVQRPPDTVHSSPVSRCAAPAARLAAEWRCVHLVDERLHELHFGAWQGRSWEQLERDEPAAVARYMERWREEPPPQGERPADLERRVSRWYQQLPPGEHLLVAHAGVVRALWVLLSDKAWPEAMQAPVPHLELLLVAQDP